MRDVWGKMTTSKDLVHYAIWFEPFKELQAITRGNTAIKSTLLVT